MKKETLKETILANIGGLFFAIGLCMVAKYEWNMLYAGIFATLMGVFCFIKIIPIHRSLNKSEKIRWQDFALRLVFFCIAVIIGYSISEVLSNPDLVFGIVIWIISSGLSILTYPITQYYKDNKKKLLKTTMMTIGSLMMAAGICMTFMSDWNIILAGTIIGIVGIALLFVSTIISRKENKEFYIIDIRFITAVIIEIIGGFISVYGFCKVCNEELHYGNEKIALITGLIACTIGFSISVLAIPIYIYLKSNNKYDRALKINRQSKENKYPFRNLVMIFFLYGFVGWLTEFLFFGVTSGSFANRGFVHLPVLPIYGFGGAAVTLIFSKNQKNVFIKSAVLVSGLEYVTSVILEKAFGLRWWDYSYMPLNINGRVCFFNCLIFGIGGFIMAKFISPYINLKLNNQNKVVIKVLSFTMAIILLVDFIYAVYNPHIGVGITI